MFQYQTTIIPSIINMSTMALSTYNREWIVRASAVQQKLLAAIEDLRALSAPKPLTEFTCFKLLPPELRLRIWAKACEQGRVVDVRIKIIGDRTLYWVIRAIEQNSMEAAYRIISNNAIPAILQVSSEARLEALKYYSPAFSTKCIASPDNEKIYLDSPPSAYVNWAVDTISAFTQPANISPEELYLVNKPRLIFLELKKYTTIKRLAVDLGPLHLEESRPPRHYILRELILNNRVEEIIVYAVGPTDSFLDGPYDPSRCVLIAEQREFSDQKRDRADLARLVEPVNTYFGLPQRDGKVYEYGSSFDILCQAARAVEKQVETKVEDGVPEFVNVTWRAPVIKLMAMLPTS